MNFFAHPQSVNLDISDLSLKAAVIKKRGGKFFIKNFTETKIPEDYVQNGHILKLENLTALVLKTIKEVQDGKLKNKTINTVMPETQTFIKLIQLEKREDQETLEKKILEETQKHIPYEIEEVYFDYQFINQKLFVHLKNQKMLNILIGVCPKKIVDEYFQLFKTIKLIPAKFEIEASAIIRSSLSLKKEDGEPFIFIDFGKTRSSLIIGINDLVLCSFNAPISSRNLTYKIKNTLNIDFEQAEKIKIKKGLDKNFAQGKFFQILNDELKTLLTKINFALKFFNSQFNQEIKKIYLAGGSANLKGLSTYLENSLNIKTQIADPLINIENKKIMSNQQALSFATTIGLGLNNNTLDI